MGSLKVFVNHLLSTETVLLVQGACLGNNRQFLTILQEEWGQLTAGLSTDCPEQVVSRHENSWDNEEAGCE